MVLHCRRAVRVGPVHARAGQCVCVSRSPDHVRGAVDGLSIVLHCGQRCGSSFWTRTDETPPATAPSSTGSDRATATSIRGPVGRPAAGWV